MSPGFQHHPEIEGMLLPSDHLRSRPMPIDVPWQSVNGEWIFESQTKILT
jgi:hypothetical protein